MENLQRVHAEDFDAARPANMMGEWRTQMRAKQAISELIDPTLADSFPASDPPSWTLGRDRYAQPETGVRGSAEMNKPRGSSRETPEPVAVDKLSSNMSRETKIYITEFDMKRLKGLIKFAKERWDKRVLQYLDGLDQELERAEIVPPEAIPTVVITMNSTFRICDLDSGEESLYTLVFPTEADSGKGKISILAPLGTAVLGYRAGDSVEWKVPAGVKRLMIKEIVYQPEAQGDYHY